VLSFMPQLEIVQHQVEQFIFSHFLPDTGNQVKIYLNQFSQQTRKLTVPGILMLILDLVGLERAMMDLALNPEFFHALAARVLRRSRSRTPTEPTLW